MEKSGYTDDSKFIGPRSGWFSEPSKLAEASLAQNAAQKVRLRTKANADAKAAKAREEKRLAVIEYKIMPEIAALVAERKKRSALSN